MATMATAAPPGLDITRARGRMKAPRTRKPAILREQARLLAQLRTAAPAEKVPLLRKLLALKERQRAETARAAARQRVAEGVA